MFLPSGVETIHRPVVAGMVMMDHRPEDREAPET